MLLHRAFQISKEALEGGIMILNGDPTFSL